MIKEAIKHLGDSLLLTSGLQYCPVRVRSGIAAGANWTLYPWTSYWRGTHEPYMHRFILSLGDIQGWNCWDLGAHYGIYSVGLARLVGPTGAVAAFEPNPLSFARLQRHCRMNDLDWLRLFPLAVSDEASRRELYTYGRLDSTTTHLPYDGESPGAATCPLEIQTVILDELVDGKKITPPQLIKIDVEGHGHRALAGAINSIRTSRPLILMGIHSPEEIAGTRALLDPLGYTWEPMNEAAAQGCIIADFILRPGVRA